VIVAVDCRATRKAFSSSIADVDEKLDDWMITASPIKV
jgi:hypothetical protein